MVGATTSVCVESTVRDAMFRDSAASWSAMRPQSPSQQTRRVSNHEASLLTLERGFSHVATSSGVVTSLERRRSSACVDPASRPSLTTSAVASPRPFRCRSTKGSTDS